MTRSSRILLYSIAVLVLGVAGPASTLAKGPPIKVEQADPNFAIQSEQGVPIKLKGRNFPAKAAVIFILNKAGDPNDGNEEQVVVSGDVILNPATGDLEFDINVAKDASLGDYDIEVIELSSGRKGKGTTLFSVQSKDTGGGTGSTLTAVFCLDMPVINLNPGLAPDHPLEDDQVHDYCHDRKDRVQVETGSHPGFRFDSNTKNRLPKRWVHVIVPGGKEDITGDDDTDLSTFATGFYQIDLRFNKGDGGLDLGRMLIDDSVKKSVPVNIWLDSLDDNHLPDGKRFGLAYSTETDPLNDGRLDSEKNSCIKGSNTLDAQVIRHKQDTWSIESDPDNAFACLWDLNADLSNQTNHTLVEIPFYIMITRK